MEEENGPRPPAKQPRRRIPKDPAPRFKAPDREALALAQRLVPREHLARRVQRVVERFEMRAVEARYSALGQNGFAPRQLLGLWLYASLIGLHQGTRVARALQTDCALRWLSGGHCISVAVLNRFRAENAGLFLAALEETVRWAVEEGLVRTQELGIDSVRLRAHASRSQVSTAGVMDRRRVGQADRGDEFVMQPQLEFAALARWGRPSGSHPETTEAPGRRASCAALGADCGSCRLR
ncbi:hypothetical protein OV208_31400 [Corallococcus sp. bb12-1]|uniref:transposase n=1 Tax=Corallococcus sp. bb12-1 TaxID=2996784 RepID=UPI00226F5E9E|nr:transposase [Corallococcus sp. bb12-1]MCY1045861.1 hypothetical protein [Corallococcus sp. bb12-1]